MITRDFSNSNDHAHSVVSLLNTYRVSMYSLYDKGELTIWYSSDEQEHINIFDIEEDQDKLIQILTSSDLYAEEEFLEIVLPYVEELRENNG